MAPRQMDFDPVKIYHSAHAFQLAAMRCEEARPTAPGTFEMLICPAIVNYALACEQYLKCLLRKQGNLHKNVGHELKGLFDSLSSESQQYIVDQMQTSDFTELLISISGAFIKWRYIYESESGAINLDFLRKFCALLRLECDCELGGMV